MHRSHNGVMLVAVQQDGLALMHEATRHAQT